jgi:phosphopantothenoylcysteine decarboxylase/phosphopantothenate--cysteine ligase
MTDSPALALAASYRGGKKPILVVPNMHDSLWLNPSLQKNISTLQDVIFYPPRAEEGKQKFPEPSQFADWISHQINLRTFRSPPRILLTMGSTRGYLDEVRFFGNDSSGRLGTEICQELFRRGSLMDLIIGPCSHQPDQWNKRWDVISTQEMEQAVRESLSNGAKHGIFCAAVLDYEPTARQAGKMSSQGGSFTVQLKPTEKIIRLASLLPGYKVGFKLQPQDTDAASIANRYIRQYGLNLLIHNRLGAIGQDHHAECFHAASSNPQHPISVTGKRPLAQYISRCIFADITP